MTSEELTQRGFLKHGIYFGEYEYYPTHSTTLNQYKKAKVIPDKNYGPYGNRKPDGLIVSRIDKKINVIAVIEYKKPSEFQTDKQKKIAVEQCNDICHVLGSKIGIISDGIVTIWINPFHNNSKNDYLDKTTNVQSSYSIIQNDDMRQLQKKFHITEIDNSDNNKMDIDTFETYQLIQRIIYETSPSNSILHATEKTDPTPLAKSVWQSIYISTKDSPTACLYNVVEIFIFKFLSDLGVLERDFSFNHIIKMYEEGYPNKEVLEHYARKCRKKIKELFMEGSDNTTIINGTIFVNKDGEPVLSQATLFRETIYKYHKFGDLRNIKKEFKTKLFETFLKQSKDKGKLGQFFTPRKVVKAMVEMANIDKSTFIFDPFCGVGGFVLEPFQISSILKNQYTPVNGKINPEIKLLGYDTGREDSDEQRRTIILAKANMLIYLSDIIEKHPQLNKAFEDVINNTFHFLSDSNLGTLKEIISDNKDKPDLILTNPPYITSGMTTIRKQIEEEGLDDYYANSGKGVEGLCLKWIINNLKIGGSAFVILPDSIFNVYPNKGLRDELLNQCYINCIISLPIKTFFTTSKKTYILGITKKENIINNQTHPVFTYLVSSIGETLDVNRFEIEDNDLDKAKNLFNQYKGSPTTFLSDDPRCKIFPIDSFKNEKYWVIDRWWSNEEREILGIKEKEDVMSIEDYKEELLSMNGDITKMLSTLSSQELMVNNNFKTVSLGNIDYFKIESGGRIRKEDINKAKGKIPVFTGSKDKNTVMGYVSDDIVKYAPNAKKFNGKYITINANGSVGIVFLREGEFYLHDDVMLLHINNTEIVPEYILYELHNKINVLGYNWSKKLYRAELETIMVDIPVNDDGHFNAEMQKEIFKQYRLIDDFKNIIKIKSSKLIDSKVQMDEGL